jgi:predicted acetyltransferase
MTAKEKIKALWELCFDDTKEFVDMYFRLRYTSGNTLCVESGDEVLSTLQALPYPMTYCGKLLRTTYIYAACTHPDYRGRGVMRHLLEQAFANMARTGVTFSTLIPATPELVDYYASMGYAQVFTYSERRMKLPDFLPSKGIQVKPLTNYSEEAYRYFDRKMRERPCCVQHLPESFRTVLGDLAVSDGIMLVARRGSSIVGILAAYREDGEVKVSEVVSDDKDAEYTLFHALAKHTSCDNLLRIVPAAADTPAKLLGMARVIHAKEALQLYAAAFPDKELQFSLVDKQLAINNGYYYLCHGRCMYTAERLQGTGTYHPITVSELSAQLFDGLYPYMSLMLD